MTKRMRISFFGSSLVSAYDNGPATYFRGMLHALSRRGHEIRFYEPAVPERLAHRDILDPEWAQVRYFLPDGPGVEAAMEDAADADVVIKASGIGVFDESLEAAIPLCTASHALSIYWDLDPAATLERLRRTPDDPWHTQLQWYDLVLLRCGGEAAVDAFQQLGVQTCFPIYSAVDPATHFPVTHDASYDASMVFLGHRAPDRDDEIQQYLFDVANALPARRFLLGGCGWEDVAMPPNVDYVGYVYTPDHNQINCSATAVLNATRAHRLPLGYAPTTRLFEAAGAGACVISDTWRGIETFFEPDHEIVLIHAGDEVTEQLRALNVEHAAAIGRRARERALAHHTYDQRAAELEALLEGFDRQWASSSAL